MYIQIKVATLVALCCLSLWPATAEAQNSEKFVLVYYDEGRLDAFPETVVTERKNANNQLCIKTVSDTAFYYNENRVDSVVVRSRDELSSRFASITQLKLNNKYNDQVYDDVYANIIGDSIITAEVAAIGKWLTPSIQLSDETAHVYVGRERQETKMTRRSYANDVYYTVAKPNQRMFTQTKVKDEVWSDAVGQYTETPVTLTATSFSSNLPGQTGEGFEQMIDGNVGTIWHSTWNVTDPTEKETIINTHPYLDIALPEQLRRIRFGYTTRNTGVYWPLSLTLLASTDGENWTEIKQFTADNDGLPRAAGTEFLSDVIDLGRNYRHLRLYLNSAAHRLYMVLAEFQLKKVQLNANPRESELIEPAEYRYQMEPFGRRYRVHFDWLTDRSTNVPVVNIDVE
ncbi:MAG: discoidin domain-containing protein, partial [Prevotella sp.]|nr:discoidin domain-containing protein [Prevotella sp.]